MRTWINAKEKKETLKRVCDGDFTLVGYDEGLYMFFIVTGGVGCAVRRIGDSLYMCFVECYFAGDARWSFATDSKKEIFVRNLLEERLRDFVPDKENMRLYRRLRQLFFDNNPVLFLKK